MKSSPPTLRKMTFFSGRKMRFDTSSPTELHLLSLQLLLIPFSFPSGHLLLSPSTVPCYFLSIFIFFIFVSGISCSCQVPKAAWQWGQCRKSEIPPQPLSAGAARAWEFPFGFQPWLGTADFPLLAPAQPVLSHPKAGNSLIPKFQNSVFFKLSFPKFCNI